MVTAKVYFENSCYELKVECIDTRITLQFESSMRVLRIPRIELVQNDGAYLGFCLENCWPHTIIGIHPGSPQVHWEDRCFELTLDGNPIIIKVTEDEREILGAIIARMTKLKED